MDQLNSPTLTTENADDPTSPPPRSRSILNLTSSTLLGIYSRTGYQPDRDDSTTPWGTGSETPIEGRSRHSSQPDGSGLGIDPSAWQDKSKRRRSDVLDTSATRTRQRELARSKGIKRKGIRNYWAPTLLKVVALGAFGWCYGVLISHLHDKQNLAPVKVEGIPHHSRGYLIFWGGVAVVLGLLMPWLDHIWEDEGAEDTSKETDLNGKSRSDKQNSNVGKGHGRGGRGPGWNDVVRSIGALVGIAFAIRRLPWQSTLQLSLTLALLNPAIWYLLDRTSPGFILSTFVSLTGTALCLAINPDLIPPPSPSNAIRGTTSSAVNSTGSHTAHAEAGKVAGVFSHESVGVATWIASVLFISCVCFGSIGRRL
ncbi:hypothetical protein K461DRAFT_289471 [Myriangium duriaei CBS 260.36]|uniref:INSIG domain-containing protein n=1 Tax=Myriangium duriaei CBS 260.36 TaxID=1168546 RepID=A0A9P4JDR0_9PEZI|nr:hypothetical protein K461DRAFT_289471 [Myriangium duriaei CBS 260.36]